MISRPDGERFCPKNSRKPNVKEFKVFLVENIKNFFANNENRKSQ